MDIFESLENLNVSEECFSDIIDIVEKLTQEKKAELSKRYRTMLSKFRKDSYAENKSPEYSLDNEKGQRVFDYVKKRLGKLNYNPSSAKREEALLFRTESLENLNVSEECFDDIVSMVEAIIEDYNPDNFPGIARGRRKQKDKEVKNLRSILKDAKVENKKKTRLANNTAVNAMKNPEDEDKQRVAYLRYKDMQKSDNKLSSLKREILDKMSQSNELKNLTAQFKGHPNRFTTL